MNTVVHTDRRAAVGALVAAGLLWGLTVPLSKRSLEWLDGPWLTLVRFAVAAAALALVVGVRDARARRAARDLGSAGAQAPRGVWSPAVLAAGALGYGAVILLQNAGIARTSVSHAALIVGAVPALVAVLTVVTGRGSTTRRAWTGYGVALAGIAMVAGAGDGSATPQGDALVLASAILSAVFVVAQSSLLVGRDPIRVTTVQMAAGATVAVPLALVNGLPHAPGDLGAPLAVAGLALAGTLLPMALFAQAQTKVPAAVAGAFLNLEPVVGAAVGAVAFHDAFGAGQASGGVLVVAGLLLSALQPKRAARDYPHGDAVDPPAGASRGARRDRRRVGRPRLQSLRHRGVAAVVARRLERWTPDRRRGPRRRRQPGRRSLAAGAAPGG